MNVRMVRAKRLLTPQKSGFLAEGLHPFTHSLTWAAGCGFGKTYCGKYCYAQALPNWLYNRQPDENWGDALVIKENAPELLDEELAKARKRHTYRIFMSAVTDPYQPMERRFRLTRACLQVFQRYDDLDLLLIQTRSPFVTDDLELLAAIPYAYLSMTIETDRGDLPFGPNKAFLDARYAAVQAAVQAGVKTQIVVSPCLPYTDGFADWLVASGAHRLVVDTFIDGDGSRGERTARLPFAEQSGYDWRNADPARQLYDALQSRGLPAGWSVDGFAAIPPRVSPMFQ